MTVRILRLCSVMVPPGTEVELDETTAESLVRAKMAEEIEPPPSLPKIETPKRRYRGLSPPDLAPEGDKEDA